MTIGLEKYSRDELIEEIKKLKKQKKFGIIWEDKSENVIKECNEKIPVVKENEEKAINDAPGEPTNIIIEGDNYHALSVLNYTHERKIDVIYIDPPYNTGNKDFVYNDCYVDREDSFRHSKWLSFMEKRLRLAKNLLSDDGVIFISIDDNEQAELKLLCDAIFNEDNFVALYPRLTVKGGKTQTNLTTNNCDYVMCYALRRNMVEFGRISMEDDPAYKYSDDHVKERGKYHTKQMLDTISLGYVPSLDYPIEHNGIIYYPGGTPKNNGYRWTWSRAKYDFAVRNDFVEFKRGRVMPKKYMHASIEKNSAGDYYIAYDTKEKNYSQLEFLDNNYSNANGNNELKRIGFSEYFSYPKPVKLVKQILRIFNKKDVTVLDFFAGSGTTGQAAMELNKEDGGHRQFILVTNNEANGRADAGADGIAEKVTYPRIKTVITGVRPDGSKYSDGIPANLCYFKADFVEKGKTTDDTRDALITECCDMIRIRENAFDLVASAPGYKFYRNKKVFVSIIFDQFVIGEVWKKVEELNTEKLPVHCYNFSYNRHANEEEIPEDTELEWKACSIPETILEVYKKIMNKKEI